MTFARIESISAAKPFSHASSAGPKQIQSHPTVASFSGNCVFSCALHSNPSPKFERAFDVTLRHATVTFARFETSLVQQSLPPTHSRVGPKQIQSHPTVAYVQRIFCLWLSLTVNPLSKLERAFNMSFGYAAVTFARLESR